MGILRLPRPPGTSPDGSPVGGRRVPLRYGGSGRPPSHPGRLLGGARNHRSDRGAPL